VARLSSITFLIAWLLGCGPVLAVLNAADSVDVAEITVLPASPEPPNE
jgi:hypothetical protein